LIKYVYFVLYKEVSNIKDLINIFFKVVIVNYKVPKEIIFNKRSIFTLIF
ncbi:uncharacterized protein CCOS01_11756, partial [Colletotrichum costaricense]